MTSKKNYYKNQKNKNEKRKNFIVIYQKNKKLFSKISSFLYYFKNSLNY